MIGRFLALIASMLIVSLPFLATIAGRYHLRILNPAPSSWVYGPLLLGNFEKSLGQLFAPQPLLFAITVLGMLGVIKQRNKRLERGLLLLWTIISALWLGSTIVWQVLQQNNVIFPNIVPGAHFLFYWKAAESALFGCGLIAVCRFSARAIVRSVRVSAFRVHPIAHGLLVGALALIFVGILPTYLTRAEFTASRESAQNIGQDQDKIAAYEWVRQNTQTDDVFLASDILVTFVVGPAGRKTVAANQLFSNPYVEWQTRAIDRDAMLDALSLGDQNRYRELAQKYGVAWIIAAGNRAKGIDAASSNFLNKVFSKGRVSIYQVRSQ